MRGRHDQVPDQVAPEDLAPAGKVGEIGERLAHGAQDIIRPMSDASRSTTLDRTTLFARLADAGAGTTVVTPNLRLAQELMREFDGFQVARGLSTWNAPDMLP